MRDSVRNCAKWAREKARGPGDRGPRPPGPGSEGGEGNTYVKGVALKTGVLTFFNV